jgi:hypothetical protein
MDKFANYSEGGEGGGGQSAPQASSKQQPGSGKASAPSPPKSPPADLPAHQVLAMPALSPTMVHSLAFFSHLFVSRLTLNWSVIRQALAFTTLSVYAAEFFCG